MQIQAPEFGSQHPTEKKEKLAVMVHTCNPRAEGVGTGRSLGPMPGSVRDLISTNKLEMVEEDNFWHLHLGAQVSILISPSVSISVSLCLCLFLSLCVSLSHTHTISSTHSTLTILLCFPHALKEVLNAYLERGHIFQVSFDATMWLHGIELRTFGRAASALNL